MNEELHELIKKLDVQLELAKLETRSGREHRPTKKRMNALIKSADKVIQKYYETKGKDAWERNRDNEDLPVGG